MSADLYDVPSWLEAYLTDEADFDTLVCVATILLQNYPENSIVSNESGDPGARFTYHLREALRALDDSRECIE